MNNRKTVTKTIKTSRSHSKDAKVVKIRTENNGRGAIKTLIIAVLISTQLFLMVELYIRFAIAFRWYLIFSWIMSLLTCIYVLSSKKNGLSKAVWILFMMLTAGFGYVIYILSDERIFFREPKKKYRAIFKNAEKYSPGYQKTEASSIVTGDAEYLYRAGKFTAFTDTEMKYFPSGAQLFDDVIERLKEANKFIFIEYFIISDGVLLNRIFSILKEKAARGVDIRIIYDDMGSNRTLSTKTKYSIITSGIKLQPFNRLIPFFSVAMNYRDHRKMIIVDGETAYSGGSNLADEYINEKRMHGYWKDTGIRMDGPATDSFTIFFLRQWEYLTGKPEDYSPFLGLYKRYESNSTVIPYADGLDYDISIGKNVYENIISAANKRLYIMTPYFIPDDTIMQLLSNKAMSGVDIRIILPGVPDKKFVYNVSRNNAEKLIASGVKIYCMKDSFVHSKLMLTENSAVVGSVNMDLRSFYQQFECAVYTNAPCIMDDIALDFEKTFDDCICITDQNKNRRNIIYRMYTGFLQLFAPFM